MGETTSRMGEERGTEGSTEIGVCATISEGRHVGGARVRKLDTLKREGVGSTINRKMGGGGKRN